MHAVSLVRTPELLRAAFVLAGALLVSFVLGAAAGYSVRALAPVGVAVNPAAAVPPASACPAGSHAAVYYSAHAWSCVAD
jgi:hypothetical protein